MLRTHTIGVISDEQADAIDQILFAARDHILFTDFVISRPVS
jgi:hypothetical protein